VLARVGPDVALGPDARVARGKPGSGRRGDDQRDSGIEAEADEQARGLAGDDLREGASTTSPTRLPRRRWSRLRAAGRCASVRASVAMSD
jgi:hypothetical protein